MWIHSRKFNEEKNIITLDCKYIFSFLRSDGFNERLLNAELLIDHNFDYTFQMAAFQHEKITKNKSDFFIEKGRLTGKIFNYLERLLDSEYKTLHQDYSPAHLAITDSENQMFILNFDTESLNVNIIDGYPKSCFETDAELLLFEFNECLKNWVETKYQYWLQV